VQELAPGKTLSDWSESGWRCTEAEVKDIASQILEILSYLHNLTPPVIHRDLKPSNILRTESGQISLVDFGAVRQAYHDTFMRGSTVVGTFGYMAPEQFRSQAVPATDLYGLGATILALLTNRSPAELTQSNLKLSFRNKIQVSPTFADWLETMLEPDPADRFESATIALAALKNPKSLAPKRPWRKIAAIGLATAIGFGTLDYYKYYFLNWWGFAPVEAFYAIWQYRDVNKVKSLLDRGVSPNAKDASGSSLIHYAVTNNQIEIANLLIDRGADINAHYGRDGHTVLHLAVLHQDGEMTKLLLDNKADPNVRDHFYYTPLHISVLRERAPYLSNRSYYGLSHLRDREVSIESIKHLLSNKADVNAIGGNINNNSISINGASTSGLDNNGQQGSAITFIMDAEKSMNPSILNINNKYLEARDILTKVGGKSYSCKDENYKGRNICFLND
jgi:serine/threonine protein kinase